METMFRVRVRWLGSGLGLGFRFRVRVRFRILEGQTKSIMVFLKVAY